jgi:galactose-1-phosphate uridylyltransferase
MAPRKTAVPKERCCDEIVEVSARVDAVEAEHTRWREDTTLWRSNHERRETDSNKEVLAAVASLSGEIATLRDSAFKRLPNWATMFIAASIGTNGILVGVIIELSASLQRIAAAAK